VSADHAVGGIGPLFHVRPSLPDLDEIGVIGGPLRERWNGKSRLTASRSRRCEQEARHL